MIKTRTLKRWYYSLHEKYNKYRITKHSNKKVKDELENKKILTKEQKQEITDFYKPYVKNVNTIFHEFYYEKTGKFYTNYLPDDLYYTKIDMYYNDWENARILDNKCLYSKLFPNVNQPEIFAYRMGGFWYDSSMTMLSKEKIIEKTKEEQELFIKIATQSQGGKGVFYIKSDKKSLGEQLVEIAEANTEDLVIQKVIKQHPELAKLNKSSVNTVRIISLLTEQGVKIYSAILRMGVDGSKVDNASSGGITCGIKENGQLRDTAYFVSGKKYSEHPTSKAKFSDITVPEFQKMCNLVKNIHPLIPHSKLASWDLAIDENENIILIEVNMKYGELDFHQLNNGPLFGDDTKKILDEVFKKA